MSSIEERCTFWECIELIDIKLEHGYILNKYLDVAEVYFRTKVLPNPDGWNLKDSEILKQCFIHLEHTSRWDWNVEKKNCEVFHELYPEPKTFFNLFQLRTLRQKLDILEPELVAARWACMRRCAMHWKHTFLSLGMDESIVDKIMDMCMELPPPDAWGEGTSVYFASTGLSLKDWILSSRCSRHVS